MSHKHILVVNSGSSSVKLGVFRGDECLYKGAFERVNSPDCVHKIRDLSKSPEAATVSEGPVPSGTEAPNYADCIKLFVDTLAKAGIRVDAIGHRVVHGGLEYQAPVLIDETVFERLSGLSSLAPLHQPFNLAGVHACEHALPGLPQVACFDTAFHSGRDVESRMYSIPFEYARKGVMAYGFHGLSYEFVSSKFAEVFDHEKRDKVVVCHLGNGSSVCAVKDGRGVLSSMGFTALEGLPMGTRSGAIDPGVLLYLLEQEGLSVKQVSDLLYKKSGLLGVSGLSSDVRDLEKAASEGHEGASRALAHFAERIAEQAVRMANAMGGIEAIVFTAGIGENSAVVRGLVCERLGWLGMRLDPKLNAVNASKISYPSSSISAWVIPTNEELVIAKHADRLAF